MCTPIWCSGKLRHGRGVETAFFPKLQLGYRAFLMALKQARIPRCFRVLGQFGSFAEPEVSPMIPFENYHEIAIIAMVSVVYGLRKRVLKKLERRIAKAVEHIFIDFLVNLKKSQ